MAPIVEICDGSKEQVWNDFAGSNPECWLYHHFGWKAVIEQSYKHQCHYLACLEAEKITGILPLVLVRSRLFGASLTSLPFLDSSGLVADSQECSQALLAKAIELGHSQRVGYIDLRQTTPLRTNLQTDTRKVSLILDLLPDKEQLWKRLSSERRNRIRKAQKSGLSSEIGGREKLPIFYRIWAENMRDLGSPAHSYVFFEKILQIFEKSTRIILVKHGDVYIGGAIMLCHQERTTLPWVSSLRKYFHLYPNNILYWEAMLYAVDNGHKVFDFGRSSRDSGTYNFKILWGAQPRQLYWQYMYLNGHEHTLPGTESLKFRIGAGFWKRLPVGLSIRIGPLLRKKMTV